MNAFLGYGIVSLEPTGFYQRTLEVAERYGLSTTDAEYVTLASIRSIDLWTDDERLLRTLGGRVPQVWWIGDYRRVGSG